MVHSETEIATEDLVWQSIRQAAATLVDEEPALGKLVHACVLNQTCLEASLSYILSQRLGNEDTPALLLRQMFDSILTNQPEIEVAARADLAAVHDRDPACNSLLEALLFFKGYHAIQTYRLAHALLVRGRRAVALHLQNRMALIFGIDIHPAAQLGSGIIIDHGTGVVIGETAVVGDGVSMLHCVTLGGTGKETGDRHPKIGDGAMIGAGAGIFGNVRIGSQAKIAAGSVVLKDVPAHCTAAGVPARLVRSCANSRPPLEMDKGFD